MLRIIQNKAAAGAKRYYSHSDYLSEGQELAGVWGGKGAELLGLKGLVEKLAFDRLCDNQRPESGDQLTLRQNEDRTVGYDFNFHVPKGVSVAYAINQDVRILNAFQQSVRETMSDIERDAKTRVRKHGVEADREVGNLVWAEFVHTTARPVAGLPDPHLHAHCFVFNAVHDPTENVWKAGQFRGIKRDAPYFEAAFHARFAKRMKELGYTIKREGRTWDIAEITKSVSKKFSRRADQIDALAQKKGIKDAKTKDGLAAKTRESKQSQLSMSELRDLWRERLDESESASFGLIPDAVTIVPQADATRKAMSQAILHCFERDSVVRERKILAEALRAGVGEVNVEDIGKELEASEVITRTMGDEQLATTPAVLAEEQAMLAFARASRGSERPMHADWAIQRQWLSADQKEAVRHITQSTDGVTSIRGGAGTGKTSLMQEAVAAIKAGGHEVYAFAPSAEASRGVLKAEGFENATTIAELLASKELQSKIRNQVIWIDEASLLGTRTLHQVFELSKENNFRVILSGDWKQHGSVERGAAMRLLEQQGGIKPAQVKSIQRQKGQYKDAVRLVSDGFVQDGFDAIESLGWVHEISEPEERFKVIAGDFANTLIAKNTVLAVSPTHAEGQLLSNAIRSELQARGLVDKDERSFLQLKPLRLTEAEKADAAFYEAGDVVIFHQNAKGFKAGQRVTIDQNIPPVLLSQANRYEVYRPSQLNLAKGDTIRITVNSKTADGRHRLNNGAMYQVRDFDRKGDIVLNNGWIIAQDSGHVALGYVSTSHAAQGKTVDRVLISESTMSLTAAGREQFYVSLSRARHSAAIYTDDVASLRESIVRTHSNLAATELLQDGNRTCRQQMHRERILKYGHTSPKPIREYSHVPE